ncbi:YoaK family protein [Olivibacter sp. CPCC 100613]|uniref:YoaK family protein n=1 Tax=Olivibacter sp. CPCC 100613 TaxID=3079931 RepID=UPI002FF74367
MFRHKGKTRTFKHNMRLASMLSFVAGNVNIIGLLSVSTLTTNVTGHFAFFAEQTLQKNYGTAAIFLFYIVFFLLGAFFCGFVTQAMNRIRPSVDHTVSMLVEITLLLFLGFLGDTYLEEGLPKQYLAFLMLFSMGLQNALVTTVSQSVVRTTHLTGLFTDMGIELSQLFFFRRHDDRKKLGRSIKLRIAIIFFFFLGSTLGGFMYQLLIMKTTLIASAVLILALLYDNLLFRIYLFKRKIRQHVK